MEEELEPALKRAKITSSPERNVWTQWLENLRLLQTKLLTGCLCNEGTLQLQRPPVPSNLEAVADFREEYVLQFISTLELLISVALKQHSKEFICRRILHAAEDASSDVCIWELLLESLNSRDRFISYAASKALTKFLLWTKLPEADLQEFFKNLFTQILSDSNDSPQKLSNLIDTIRGVIDYKEEEDHHPLEAGLSDGGDATSRPPCQKVEIDTGFEDVKTLCVQALENSWTPLITKFHKILTNYEDKYEAPTITFLSLWQSIVSVKTNLSVIATKNFHLQLQSFVPHLNSTIPAVLWKKILDLFSEILCYGSTLSLQDCLADEPCELAHLILRRVKSRQFLQGVPYTRTYTGFGGHQVGNVDWEWKSGSLMSQAAPSTARVSSSSSLPGPSRGLPFAGSSSSFDLARKVAKHRKSNQEQPNVAPVSATIVIGGQVAEEPVEPEDIYADTGGDKVLLQKLVLVVLKSVAVTVKETREDSDSEEEAESGSESDGADMLIIEKSIREVFQQLDTFIKSLLPYHPATPLGEWIVKLFSDQDDALVEAMLCALDTFTGFHGRVDITSNYLKTSLDPVITFNAFATTVSQDKDVLLDLLMSNETCFLLYFLRYLKFCWKNWETFVASCGRDFEKVIGLLIRLRMSVGKLVEKSLFPYNINPVLRLLERCEELYESSCEAK